MFERHLSEIQNPPFKVGQHVRLTGDYPGGEIYRIVGMRYDYRQPPQWAWDFWLATEQEIADGHGGTDGFTPNEITLCAPKFEPST